MSSRKGLVALWLFFVSVRLFGRMPAAATNPPDDLDALDAPFTSAYDARATALKATNPPYVEVSGSSLFLHLHGQDAIKARVLTDPYHHLADIAHVPFTIYLILKTSAKFQLSDEQLTPLRNLLAKLMVARNALESAGFEPRQKERQKQILDASIRLENEVLTSKAFDEASLRSFARAMAPLMLMNADEAGCFQVQATHQQMIAWKSLMSQQDWQNLHVVIKNSHQARYRDAATQYFAWLLGGNSPQWAFPGETNRVVYAETLFGKQTVEDELIDVLVDFEASQEFFGDDWRMTEDILSNGAARCVANLPGTDRTWSPNARTPQ